MNVFSRTFLPAAVESGLARSTVSRHLPILRQCVAGDDAVTLLARCVRPDRRLGGEFLLLLTHRRLVVVRETWPLRRLRLHLNSDLRHLRHVSWTTDPHYSQVELAATAIDGVRERFCIRGTRAKHVWRLDTLFTEAFRPRSATDATQASHGPANQPPNAEQRPDPARSARQPLAPAPVYAGF
ncbi:hypothetical protein [Pilimelia columellifera]|uniref:Uncharacterized protein n=1 Tax=Pilimelia columellifera subsp. columellifera TaxID=706583 RepID=A0ABP6AL13_9ACTN